MWKLRLAIIGVVIVGCLLCASPLLASNTATFTVTARGDIGFPHAPTNFTVIMIEDSLVRVEWTPDTSCNTSIRVKYDSPPVSADDGYLLYYGPASSANDTYLNLDVMWSKQYYVAASQSANGTWSLDYVYDYVENPKVTEIAESITELSNGLSSIGSLGTVIGALVFLIPLIIFSVLAFWKENHILFMATFGIATITGFEAPNIISGTSETTTLGIAFGLLLLGYALFCAAMAFKLMFWKERSE